MQSARRMSLRRLPTCTWWWWCTAWPAGGAAVATPRAGDTAGARRDGRVAAGGGALDRVALQAAVQVRLEPLGGAGDAARHRGGAAGDAGDVWGHCAVPVAAVASAHPTRSSARAGAVLSGVYSGAAGCRTPTGGARVVAVPLAGRDRGV
eukprot:ctg_706.g382